jgi:hypothetical protein
MFVGGDSVVEILLFCKENNRSFWWRLRVVGGTIRLTNGSNKPDSLQSQACKVCCSDGIER